MADPPKIYKALYNFKGSNNDELWFSKGDHITITQSVEGGWWEGTLDGKTGWFPSNFVKEIRPDSRSGAQSPTGTKPELLLNKRESIMTYHDVVIRSLKDTERTFVNDLHLLLQTYLRPLANENILTKDEYSQLVGNLEEISSIHHILLASLDECAKQPIPQQRIGGVFINLAEKFSGLYKSYCGNHPRAVDILQKHREPLNAFMESKGAPPPGIETLTTSLSKPFTRQDKYSSMLKELERHTDESHVDRGDTQRAISVYREIAGSCADIRRQKEVEYEIMNSTIKGWEGEEISKMGEVLLLSHVRVTSENGEKKERLFLLFPTVLLVLSVSPRLSQYIYEGKLPLTGMTINPLEDDDNHAYAYDITGSLIDRRVVCCGSNTEKRQWVDTLRQQAKAASGQHGPAKPQNVAMVSSVTQPSVTNIPAPKPPQTAQVATQPAPKPTPPPTNSAHHSIVSNHSLVTGSSSISVAMTTAPWSLSCLRPAPPLRPVLVGGRGDELSRSPRSARKLLGAGKRKPAERALSEDDHMHHTKRNDPKTLEEDALILKVIEAYCTSAKARHTVNSLDLTKIRLTPHEMRDAILESPQVIIVEEEKIFVEENKGGQVVIEEKSLVDTVYSLKDQVKDLRLDHQALRRDLEDERKARRRLESTVRRSLHSLVTDSNHTVTTATSTATIMEEVNSAATVHS